MFTIQLFGWRRLAPLLVAIGLYASATAATLVEYDFTQSLQGWSAGTNIVNMAVTAEGLRFDSDGGDPQLLSPVVPFSSSQGNTITLRMRSNSTSTDADLFYGQNFNATDRVRFQVTADGQWHDYVILIPSQPSGAKMRLDPAGATGQFTIAWIRVEGVSDKLTMDNGVLKIELDLKSGGAITYLGRSGTGVSLVNIHDRGRMIQQSYYAGQSLDRRAEGQSGSWSPWPWNPIQVGDAFGHSGVVLESSIVNNVAYTKTHPLLWDMNNEFGQCHLEQWTQLDGQYVHVRNRITTFRDADDIWTVSRLAHQELPAIYTTGDFPYLFSYTGQQPYQNQAVSQIINNPNDGFIWDAYEATEFWAANVNSTNPATAWGLGVYIPITTHHIGGYAGSRPEQSGGPLAGQTAYIAPVKSVAIERNDVFEYEYTLILGTLDEIRNYAVTHRPAITTQPPIWLFNRTGDTEEWGGNGAIGSLAAQDGTLQFSLIGGDPQLSIGSTYILASEFRYLHLRLKNVTASTTAQLFWTNSDGGPGTAGHVITIPITSNDTAMKEYTVDLATISGWQGLITGLRLDPTTAGSGTMAIDYIAITGEAAFTPPLTGAGGWVLYR